MSFPDSTSEVLAYMDRARRRLDAGEYDAVAHECRKALEFIASYMYAEVIHKPYRPKEGLDGAIKASCFRDLWPPLLRGKIALVKELGDQGSHANPPTTEREAAEAFDAIHEIADFFRERFVERGLAALVERSPLRIEVATDLREITFTLPGGRLSVARPVLLLESLAGRNKAFRFSDARLATPNPFSEHTLSTLVLNTMGDANLIRFGDTEVLWDGSYSEWPPSIDSLFSAPLLLQEPALQEILTGCGAFAEVGCGTGFISSIVCSAYRIQELCLTDIHERVLMLAEFNVRRNVPTQVITKKRGPGLRAFNLAHNTFDVVFANPPYIRLNPDEVESVHSTRSTGLLDELLQEFWRYSRHLVLNYSSCCESAVQSMLAGTRGEGVLLEQRIVGRRAVPFRVVDISADEIAILSSQGRLIDLEVPEQQDRWPSLLADNRGYRFWHEVILAIFTAHGGRL